MIKAIIFDFDGVILESTDIKTMAFEEIGKKYAKEFAKEFLEYHKSNMGISRYVKFKYFYENIIKSEYNDTIEKKLGTDFNNIVFDKMMKCPFVPGAEDFLKQNYLKYKFFIASGTPQEELDDIVANRKLRKYFTEVHGTPSKKEEIISLILNKYDIKESEAVFVGDAITDLKAANKCNLKFIGRNTKDNKDIFINIGYKVDNLLQIYSFL